MGYNGQWNSTDQVAAARDRFRPDRPLRHARRQRRRRLQPLQPVGRLCRAAGRWRIQEHRVLVQVPAEPVLQLHLLPQRPGQRRPVRAGRRPQRLWLDRPVDQERRSSFGQPTRNTARLRVAPGPHRAGRACTPPANANACRRRARTTWSRAAPASIVSNDTQWSDGFRSIARPALRPLPLRRRRLRAPQNSRRRDAPASLSPKTVAGVRPLGTRPNTSSTPATASTATTHAA